MEAHTPRDMLAVIKASTGLSEVALAKKLNVSQPTVNRILNGQGNCSSSTLLAIQGLLAEVRRGGHVDQSAPEVA